MTELNGKTCKISVKSPFAFTINADTRTFKPYTRQGIVEQVKVITDLKFKSLK